MAEVGRFPHLAEFRKGVHHIYFFKLIQAPQEAATLSYRALIIV